MKKLSLVLITAILSYGHNVGISENADGSYKVTHGHKKDLELYPQSKVKSVVAYGANLQEIHITKQMIGELNFKTDKKPLMILSKFDNGIWTKGHFGWENKPKNEVQNPTISKQFLKFSKTIYGYDKSLEKPIGEQVEIVPLSDPFLKDAKTIKFQVFVDGKIAQNYEASNIEIDEKMQNFQNKQSIELPIKDGKNTILVELEKSDKVLDGISLSGVLEFERK